MPLSTMSSPLLIELRLSRMLRVALIAIALLAVWALQLSNAPEWSATIVPLLLLGAWPRRLPGRHVRLVFHADGSIVGVSATSEESPVRAESLRRRGPLSVLTVVDSGRRHHYALTPETLSTAQRRHLRLWFDRFGNIASDTDAAAHV